MEEPKINSVNDVYDLFVQIFGVLDVDDYEKNTIHVWDSGLLAVMAKYSNKQWTVRFSAGLNPFAIAQAATTFAQYFDFEVGLPFFRLPDGQVLEAEAALIYVSKNIEKLWFGKKHGTLLQFESREETFEHFLFTNRAVRMLN